MNFNFNHFSVNDPESAKVLKKYFAKRDRVKTVERIVLSGLFYICGKVIISQYEEIQKLKEDAKKTQKGD